MSVMFESIVAIVMVYVMLFPFFPFKYPISSDLHGGDGTTRMYAFNDSILYNYESNEPCVTVNVFGIPASSDLYTLL